MDGTDFENFRKTHRKLYDEAIRTATITPAKVTRPEIESVVNGLYRKIAAKYVVVRKVIGPNGVPRVVLQTTNLNLAPLEVVAEIPPELLQPVLKAREFGLPSDDLNTEYPPEKPADGSTETPSEEVEPIQPPAQTPTPQEIREEPAAPPIDKDVEGKLDFKEAEKWRRLAMQRGWRHRVAGVSPFSPEGRKLRKVA